MLKGIFGSNDNGSEVSSSSKRKSKRREDDEEQGSQISRRSRADSTGTSSTSKRKSSRRESTDQSFGFHPTSTAFSSTSRAPYADVAAPSVASSYATASTEQTNARMQRPEVVRNESMAEKASRSERSSGSRRDSKRDSRGDTSRSIDDDDERRNAGQPDPSKRDSRRKPSRKDTAARAAEDHENSLPQNQFPGQEPAGFGVASPYRPPGLASDYYGDHGESIAAQPGVRPDRPSILISADQAHLWEPTVEAKPPPEPSSLGQVGAAASFFGGESVPEQLTNTTPSRPGKGSSSTPGRKQNLQPRKDSAAGGASPRSSPGPDPGRRPLPQSQNSGSIGLMGAGAAPLAAGAMATGVGAAAEYFSGNIDITPHDQPLSSGVPEHPDDVVPGSGRPPPSTVSGSQSYHTTTENMQNTNSTITSSSRPPRPSQSSSSNLPLYEAAAAAAGVAGAAYLAHEHTSEQHEQAFSQSPTDYQGRPSSLPFRPGQNQSQASFGPPQQQIRRRRTGAFGKFVDWFQDPVAVAEYEAYTEAIGVCKYCFEPGTTPAEAPRKHYYRRRRPSSGSRYGSTTRVDKLTRYSSEENLRRRNSKKGYSTTEKVLATGLAGVGVAAVANEVYKNKNDFDDTYSVKSGHPDNRSRVSFQEKEEERYSTSKRKSRRESEGLSRRDSDRRRQSGPDEIRYEKRSSRRRDSSGSDNRTTSRGGNLSTPVALAGAAAVGAALTSSASRRRSRSRSKSPRKNRKGYYSKRVSPKHSYVDLNQTLEDTASGPLGLGGFFSSPSSNSKRGKKKKGLFNFSNNSSSSSDADLVFGEGTVKRKERRGRKDDRRYDKQQGGMGDTAAILGLAATGAALAAETSRRDDKGKRKEDKRTDSNRDYDDRNRKSRRDNTNKTNAQGYEDSANDGDEGVWEDASDDDQSSVDMALAYGGRLSSRASKESLNEGTNILGWRFGDNQKKREEEKKLRRQSSKPDLPGYDPVKAGLVAGATGLAGAAAANYYSRPGPVAVESPPKNMPPLQYVDPVPIDSREQTPRKQSMQSSVSPLSFPPTVTRTSDASLEHPQPVTPISRDVYHARQSYTDGPSGPVVFDKPRRDSRGQGAGIIPVAAIGAAAIDIDSERDRKRSNRRSATMPAVVPSPKDSVSFDLTAEQEEREKRRERKRREKEARRAEEVASATSEVLPKASIITGAERSPERKLETWRLRDAVKADGPGSMEPPVRDPSPQSSPKDLSDVPTQPLPTPERETRLSEIDRQLEELYAQHREQEARKKKQMEAVGLASAAVAVGAGVVAATSSSPDKNEQRPRRKSSLRKSSKYRDQDFETESAVSARSAPSASASDTGTETASERLARKAARRVQNQRAPSPVHQHDDYPTFFVPPELKEHMAEHNRDAELEEAKIVDIVPGMKRGETFPDELYHAYGTEDTDVPPTKLPWRVPMLGLVSPTPPPRSPMISAEDSPVILATSGRKDMGEPETEDVDPRDIEPKRSNSKVTWGDHEINVYEVVTPEYERDGHDFSTSSPETSAKKDVHSSPLRQTFTADDVSQTEDKDMNQRVPPVEKMTKDQREHVAMGKDFADLPPSRDILREMPETAPLVEERKPSSSGSTPAIQFEQFNPTSSTISDGSFYQSPFASTVSDLDLPVGRSSSRVLADGKGSVAEEIPEEKSDERISKSERRRRERAEAATEAENVIPETTATQTRDLAEPHVPGGFDDTASNFNVYDYMVTTNGSTLPSASVLGGAATGVPASDVTSARDLPAETGIARPKRSDTFDEGDLIDSFATPKRAETFAEGDFKPPKSRIVTSDPEDWEKTSSSSKKSKSKSKSKDEDDFYNSRSPSSKKKSKRDSEIFNDDNDADIKSVVSSSADASRPKSKRKSSKRDDDDDTRSVVSDTKSTASEPASLSKRKSKDSSSGTPKKSGWALIGGLIGAATATKSDVSMKSDSSEKRKSKSNDSDKKRRSSKSRDRDDSAASESRRSRSASQSSAQLPAREESMDDAFVSADEHGKKGHADTDEQEMGVEQQESFLATRPELPKPTGSELEKEQGFGAGASGLPLQSESSAPFPLSLTRDLDSQAPSATVAPLETSSSVPEHDQRRADFETPTQPRQRRLSNLRTTDLGSSPTIGSPARVGRFPVSPGIIRSGSVGSPPAALATSPVTTPRSRQGRPTSSDFRSGKEFRPLYLVERHSATKVPVQEEEDTYPSLPSSRTSSAHPSLENLRGEYSDGDIDVSPQQQPQEVSRRYSSSDTRPRSPEFLDSRAATPTQSTFPGLLKREVKEKPKYEFHSPSELLEDPSHHPEGDVPEAAVGSPLPSAVGTERSSSPVTDEPGSKSRSRASSTKDVGLEISAGLVGAAAGAFAANQLTKDDAESGNSTAHTSATREVEVPESKDEESVLQPVSLKKSKKDKKDKKKDKKGKRKDSLPLPSTTEPEPVSSQDAAPESRLIEPSSAEDASIRDVLDATDATDAAAQLDEKASQQSFPFNDASNVALPNGEDDDLIDRTASLVPSHKENLSPFERAFDAARVARGLPEGMSKEAAMDALIAPAAETTLRNINITDAKSEDKNLFGDNYEIGTSKNMPGSFVQNENPFGHDFEVPPEEEGPFVSSPVSKRVEVLPVITEASTPMASSQDLSRAATEQVGPNIPAAQAGEDTWDPPSTSKKDRNKKKNDRKASVVTELMLEEPELETPATVELEQSKDIGDTPREIPSEQLDEFAWAPTKKSKKDKKAKKSKALDDLDASTPEFGTQTPTDIEPTAEETREMVIPTESAGPVAEAEQIVQAAQEGPTTNEVEPAQPVEATAEDEFAWAPTKKSKKDKKSKKSRTIDDLESESQRTGSQTLAVEEEARDVQGDVPREQGLVEKAAEPPIAEEPVVEPAEDEWAVPTKKSKKDKKSKRKTLDLDSVEPTKMSTGASEPLDVEKDESSDPVAASTARLAAGALAGVAGAAILSEGQDKPADDDEWAPTSSKKSKKDKKSKKKGKSLSLADNNGSTPGTDTLEPERNLSKLVAAEEPAGMIEEPGAIDEVERHTASADKLSAEPEEVPGKDADVNREAPVEEDEWAVSTKKSKKDKKSKKKQSLAAFEDSQVSEEAAQPELEPDSEAVSQPSKVTAEEDFRAGPEAAHVDDVTGHYFGMLKNYQPASGAPDNKAAQSTREATQDFLASANDAGDEELELPSAVADYSESVAGDAPTVPSLNSEHNFPVIPTVAHVNDVVGFHYGMLRDYKPDTTGAQESREIAEQIVPATSETTATSVPVEPGEDWAVPVKKSKKDKDKKKKKRQSTFDDTEEPSTEQSNAMSEIDAALPVAAGVDAAGVEAGISTSNAGDRVNEAAAPEMPVEEEEFAPSSSKKSKKDKKKKRQSAFDDFNEEQSSSPALEEAKDVIVDYGVPPTETAEPELPPEKPEEEIENPAQPEEQPVEFSTKKSKRDKKKKRGSTFDDFDTAPTTSADDLATFAPVTETDASQDTRDLGIPASKPQKPILGDDGWPVAQPVSEATPVEEDEWAVPMKKSKKDKKKKRTLLSWADGEDSTSQPTETSTPVELADIQMQDSAPASEEIAVKSDAQPAVVQDSVPLVVVQPRDEDGHAMTDQKRLSRSIPGGWSEEEEEQPIEDAPMADEPSQPLDEPSKLVDEPMRDVEEPRDQEINRDQHESEQAPVEEDPGYVVRKSKKDKKGKKSKKSEPVFEEPESREVEEEQAATAPEIVRQAKVENVSDEVPEEAAPEEDWAFTPKKSKKDKKSRKSKNVADELPAEPTREQEILAIPETSQESSSRDAGAEDELAVPTKKSKKDKKSKRQSARDGADEQPKEPVPFPVNDPDHVDDITGHYHGMLREYQPAFGAPDNKSSAASREVVDDPGVSHVDDVTGHYFGMLRDYRPVEGAPDNKPATSTHDAGEITRDERVPSPLSDEETRRARRARRKASPVYHGEEPEDLPGNRSLTPPADHDDMMTTALGVAAGLGLTGAAANKASARHDAGESQSFDVGQEAASKAQAPGWSFAKINAPSDVYQPQRDSGVQFADSPTLPHNQFDSRNRDSGYVKSPANRESWPEEASRDTGMLDRPLRPQSPTSSSEDVSGKRSKRVSRAMDEASARREASPIQSTSKDRSSKLFHSSPSNHVEQHGETPRLDTGHLSRPATDIHRSPSIHGHHRSREELRALSPAASGPRHIDESHHQQSTTPEPHQSIFGAYPAEAGHERGFSPPKTPLHSISEHSQDTSPSLRRSREVSDTGEDRLGKAIQHQESGRNLREAAGIAGVAGIGALAANELSRDDRPASRAKSLGKSKANTKSSRSLHRATFDPEVVPSSSTYDPSKGKGKEVERDMADVYDGHGEYPGSPMSPTRPPSMRKRQSMQQIRDLETRLDQLAAENRTLAEAKIVAERHLEDIQLEQHKSGYAGQEAVETANVQLREKDEAIARLQQELEGIRQDHARLSEVNAGLSDAHENLRSEHEQRYSQLEDQHAETHQSWQESSRELETLRGQHAELSSGMEDIVRHEIDTALAEKNAEIERLRSDLELAKEKINELQQQILSSGGDDILNFKDEDYFETACQSLCQHVQQWVLRFSKFSDTLVCRTTSQIRDEKLVDRFDLAILDGSDVDAYLTDRIKRRDVFMSVVMTMIFEYIFTRYLFGMDRDQRQTLKKLEKNLAEVGPPGAVHQWRAMTLTLLAKRETFRSSRENDTEAVVLQIYDTLAKFLPPPQNLQAQVQESLRNVMRSAVDLSIEMRTQKAEYIMLPPLQPEYDTNGDLTRKVYFNASLMNERSGETSSNDELEAQQAVVRMVLFPLVVKKGNDDGEGEDEIVVCPAQVLVARPDKKSKANSGRVVSAQSDRMSVDQMSRTNASRHSLAPSTMDMSNVI